MIWTVALEQLEGALERNDRIFEPFLVVLLRVEGFEDLGFRGLRLRVHEV